MTAPQQHARPFSVPQVAERWGCSEGLVRKLIRSGELACFRPGTLIRIAAADQKRLAKSSIARISERQLSSATVNARQSRQGNDGK